MRGTILYIIALYLLGIAVAKLIEESHSKGYAIGRARGLQAGLDFYSKVPSDVHREP